MHRQIHISDRQGDLLQHVEVLNLLAIIVISHTRTQECVD